MASQFTGKLSCDREAAIEALARGHKLTAQLRSLLRLSLPGGHSLELADALSEEALQALTVALSILKSGDNPIELSNIPVATSSCSNSNYKANPSSVSVASVGTQGRKRHDHNGRTLHYFAKQTSSPHYDGYQWRKYGQKTIRGSKFTRDYYRCTFRGKQGCPAMKRVQQQDNGDPPEFEVTYINQHTCSTETTIPQVVVDSSPAAQGRLLYFDSTDHGPKQHQPDLSSFTTTTEECNDLELWGTRICSTPRQQGSQDHGSIDSEASALMTVPCIEDLFSDPYPWWDFQGSDNDYMMMDSLDF